ncbi:hypothetical protein CALCODRAFT_507400 [Calocera cornea HHB12733]|uniref:Uncharacterized protein n=1 Tax=Calocera cornea HHB12733 TaxID=1353952 RepID=A0A165HSN2_9BASI|nr:hypothetical protein CALCODRAFT_507400 [Calocera cornea HHB12733]
MAVLELDFGRELLRLTPINESWVRGVKVPIVIQLLPLSKLLEVEWSRCRSWDALASHGPEEAINVTRWEELVDSVKKPAKWKDKAMWLRWGTLYTRYHEEALEAAGHTFNGKMMYLLHLAHRYVSTYTPHLAHILPDTARIPRSIRQAHKSAFHYTPLEQHHAAQKHVISLRDQLKDWFGSGPPGHNPTSAKGGVADQGLENAQLAVLGMSASSTKMITQRNDPNVVSADTPLSKRDAGEPALAVPTPQRTLATSRKRQRESVSLHGYEEDDERQRTGRNKRARLVNAGEQVATTPITSTNSANLSPGHHTHETGISSPRKHRLAPPRLDSAENEDEHDRARRSDRERVDETPSSPHRRRRREPSSPLMGVDLIEYEPPGRTKGARLEKSPDHTILQEGQRQSDSQSLTLFEKSLDERTRRRRHARRQELMLQQVARELSSSEELIWDEATRQYINGRRVEPTVELHSASRSDSTSRKRKTSTSTEESRRLRGTALGTPQDHSIRSANSRRLATSSPNSDVVIDLDLTNDEETIPSSPGSDKGIRPATGSQKRKQDELLSYTPDSTDGGQQKKRRHVQSSDLQERGEPHSGHASQSRIPVREHEIRRLCQDYYSGGAFCKPAWPTLPIMKNKHKFNGKDIARYTEDRRREAQDDIEPVFVPYKSLTADIIQENGKVTTRWPGESTVVIRHGPFRCQDCQGTENPESKKKGGRTRKRKREEDEVELVLEWYHCTESVDTSDSGTVPTPQQMWKRLEKLLGWTRPRPMMRSETKQKAKE